ncbi:hypothetical protein SAMN05428957_10552 [Oryzisolibacter propanilivorax]|uniref:Phosphodiesterase n=1 Tax=Oryzisolibacter propanilivorax TaxID=1527607 RepID=A0A1G9SNH9_9BURK|nr:phosphodiesterase [Oryzisolibacter propanilivorax]SDM37026.1 hypothetical protein SAMN05428957_10552 [Oryzisolibacter propanilivorax]
MSALLRPAPPDTEYEDLLGQWADLEAFAGMLLARPAQVPGFTAKMQQCALWLDELIAHDVDAALYLMFQLAGASTVGYSAAHALVCAALCQVLAPQLALAADERAALVHAAFTMNIGMTALQDALALQAGPLSPEQQQGVDGHPQRGVQLLQQCGVDDPLWLETVQRHHQVPRVDTPLAALAPAQRLARILGTIDRYAAMISPRKTRQGRSATESMRAVLARGEQPQDAVGLALSRSVGLCPPGTFVRLENGETAAVLRRGLQGPAPLVASVVDARGRALVRPRLHPTGAGAPRIVSAVPRSALALQLNHRAMVRLGLFAAHRTISLRG